MEEEERGRQEKGSHREHAETGGEGRPRDGAGCSRTSPPGESPKPLTRCSLPEAPQLQRRRPPAGGSYARCRSGGLDMHAREPLQRRGSSMASGTPGGPSPGAVAPTGGSQGVDTGTPHSHVTSLWEEVLAGGGGDPNLRLLPSCHLLKHPSSERQTPRWKSGVASLS